jgi:hypothetical protein
VLYPRGKKAPQSREQLKHIKSTLHLILSSSRQEQSKKSRMLEQQKDQPVLILLNTVNLSARQKNWERKDQ